MAGLDNIIGRISQDSVQQCDSILAEARKQAAQIKEKAGSVSEKETGTVLAEAKKQAAAIVETAQSGSVLEGKNLLLADKVSIINDTIQEAQKKLCGLPAQEYFAAVYKLIGAYALDEQGTIVLSQKDLDRLPPDFQGRVDEAAGAGKLTVSNEPRNIGGGFILVYGDIELNCTFEALIEEKRDELKDTINQIIFA